jgi:hypothetical protein
MNRISLKRKLLKKVKASLLGKLNYKLFELIYCFYLLLNFNIKLGIKNLLLI